MPLKNYERAFEEDTINLFVQGRLTLASGVAIPTTDQLAKTLIYFTPHRGRYIGLYDTTNAWWRGYRFSEVSVAVPATTVTPFDIFAYLDANGNVAIETSNWTNDTTRATALVLQDGVYCKTGDLPRRYLGTGRTTGVNGECEDSIVKRFLVNYYNREPRRLSFREATGHTYNVAAWRYWNNSSANIIEFLIPVAEDAIQTNFTGNLTAGADGQAGNIGMGIDLGTAPAVVGSTISSANAFAIQVGNTMLIPPPAAGYHFLSGIEFGNVASATTLTSILLQATIPG